MSALSLTYVAPSRCAPLSASVTVDVIATVACSRSRSPRIAVSRSWSIVTTTPPTFASSNGVSVGSSWTVIAVAVWAENDVGPRNTRGWPNARTRLPHTAVVVPTPAALTSP